MRRLAPIFCVGFAFAFGGCLLGIDNLQGGTDSGSSSDDGSASSDAMVDGSSSSDGSVSDSSTITTDGGDEGGPFCPQIGAFLCSDFDDVDAQAAIPGPWDYAYAPPGSMVTTTSILSKSPPRSAEIGTSTGTVAILNKSISTTHVDIAFDLFIQINGGNSSIVGFSIGNATLIVKPESATQTTFLEEDTLPDGGALYLGTGTTSAIATGQWVHVETIVDFPGHIAQLLLDGTQVLQRNLTGAAWLTAKTVNVSIGTADSNSTTFFYDNVVIRTE